MLPGKQSYKLIRTDLTLQGHAPIFCAGVETNIAQYFFPFFKKKGNILEGAQYIRSERKETAQYCHQVHSVDTLLTVDKKANWYNMFSCKSLVILLLLLAVSFGQRHNYMPCKIPPGDTLLHREIVSKSFQFLGYVTSTVYIDVGDNIIGCYHALDGWDDDTGGYASFVRGGIGYNYVELKITSQFNRGFWFVINVYGQ
jgi:hypothetical protein